MVGAGGYPGSYRPILGLLRGNGIEIPSVQRGFNPVAGQFELGGNRVAILACGCISQSNTLRIAARSRPHLPPAARVPAIALRKRARARPYAMKPLPAKSAASRRRRYSLLKAVRRPARCASASACSIRRYPDYLDREVIVPTWPGPCEGSGFFLRHVGGERDRHDPPSRPARMSDGRYVPNTGHSVAPQRTPLWVLAV